MHDLDKYRRCVLSILGRVPGIRIENSETSSSGGGRSAMFEMRATTGSTKRVLVVQVKSGGAPSILRAGLESLKKEILARKSLNAYGVIAAPYLTEAGIQLCKENGVGCIDLAGNCYLSAGPIYIELKGNPNPSPARPEFSLFSPKSSRISRALLSAPARLWQVQELSSEARVSIGLASRIKDQLIKEGYLQEEHRLLKLVNPGGLLDMWSEHYAYKKNRITEYYSVVGPQKLESEVQSVCSRMGLRSALALFSGAARVAPYVRMDKAFLYIERGLDDIVKALDLKVGLSGSNLMLLEPYDAGIFQGSRSVGSETIVSDLQLYLDLKSFKGRGNEAADFLRRSRITPTWNPSK